MRVFRLLIPLFLLVFSLSPLGKAEAQNLKITTWNMDWLTLKPNSDPDLPDDIPTRNEDDYWLLHQIADNLQSDIIAFEEVDGEEAAAKVFNPDTYNIVINHDPIVQNVGVALKKNISYTLNPEVTDLNIMKPHSHHALRGGLDITIKNGTHPFRMLVVHLKTGCWARPLDEEQHSCPTLYQQFHVIEEWIAAREQEKIPYMILGDFNRRLTLKDPLMQEVEQTAPLTLTTEGYASPCEDGKYPRFIDHIILGGEARNWLTPNSLSVLTYKDLPDTAHLSDHCPVSVIVHPS